jgi:mRNA-degrading endonuclease RelE of RelBE toxin-antitoxin system
MEVSANTAIQAQLSTLPASDQDRVDSMLKMLAQNPESMATHLKRLTPEKNLWEFRITSRLRALVRIGNERIEILAIARPDQLDQYRRTDSAS